MNFRIASERREGASSVACNTSIEGTKAVTLRSHQGNTACLWFRPSSFCTTDTCLHFPVDDLRRATCPLLRPFETVVVPPTSGPPCLPNRGSHGSMLSQRLSKMHECGLPQEAWSQSPRSLSFYISSGENGQITGRYWCNQN